MISALPLAVINGHYHETIQENRHNKICLGILLNCCEDMVLRQGFQKPCHRVENYLLLSYVALELFLFNHQHCLQIQYQNVSQMLLSQGSILTLIINLQDKKSKESLRTALQNLQINHGEHKEFVLKTIQEKQGLQSTIQKRID